VRALLALVPLAVSGCTGTCRKTTPYVPFLEDAGTLAARDGDVAAADAAIDGGQKSNFQKVQAALAPTGANKWSLDGLPFEAPPGSAIVAAIAQDVDGDGQRDVVAWTQPPGGGGGELRFHRGDGKGGLLAGRAVTGTTAGAEISMPAPCLAKAQATMLTLVGPHSIALDLRPNCGDAAPTQRRFAFAAFAPTPSIRWSARVAEPPPGWTFAIDVEAIDQDGDGVDDPTFNLALEGGGPPWEPGDRMVARLPYWDRPAGLSRNRSYPEASFQLVAQKAAGAAAKKADAARALPIIRRLRILHGALCTEGGAPWLEIGSERGIACGASKALEDAGFAEVRASLASNDAIVAIAARERLASPAVARTNKTRSDIDKAIEGAVPSVSGTARELKAIASTPAKGAPAWGALAFESSGKLLVRTATGVVRVDTTTFDEKEADDVASWPWEVSLPGKDARLSAVIDPCDAPNLAARVAGHDVPTGATLLPLPMLPSMAPGRCGGGSSTFSAVPVAWGGSGLYTLVAHEPVWVPAAVTTASGARATGTLPPPGAAAEGPFVLGAPRSPNGSWLVVPTRFGVLRRESGVGTLVRVKELEGLYPTLRECAISDGGGKLACIRETKVVVIDTSGAAAAPSGDE
jgi:hypothetical protein